MKSFNKWLLAFITSLIVYSSPPLYNDIVFAKEGTKTTTIVEEKRQVTSKKEEVNIPLEQEIEDQLTKKVTTYNPPIKDGELTTLNWNTIYETKRQDGYSRKITENWERTQNQEDTLVKRISTHNWPRELLDDNKTKEVIENYLTTNDFTNLITRRIITIEDKIIKITRDEKYGIADKNDPFLKEVVTTRNYNLESGIISEILIERRVNEKDILEEVEKVLTSKRGDTTIQETYVSSDTGGWELTKKVTTTKEPYALGSEENDTFDASRGRKIRRRSRLIN